MVQLEGEKMSKSKGNTVSPQRIVDEYGADTARLFIMQAAQPDFDWAEEGVKSTHRFLARLTDLVEEYAAGEAETASSDADRDTIDDYVADEDDAVGHHRGRGVRRPDVQRRAPRGAGPRGDAPELPGPRRPAPGDLRARGWTLRSACSHRSSRTSPRSCGRRWTARGSSSRPSGRPRRSTARRSSAAAGWSRTPVRTCATSSRSPASRTPSGSTSSSRPTGSTTRSRSRSTATPTTSSRS